MATWPAFEKVTKSWLPTGAAPLPGLYLSTAAGNLTALWLVGLSSRRASRIGLDLIDEYRAAAMSVTWLVSSVVDRLL